MIQNVFYAILSHFRHTFFEVKKRGGVGGPCDICHIFFEAFPNEKVFYKNSNNLHLALNLVWWVELCAN